MYSSTTTCGGDVIVFWHRFFFYRCKDTFRCVSRGICGSCVFVLRKVLFTLTIVSFLSLMSRVKSLSVRESTR